MDKLSQQRDHQRGYDANPVVREARTIVAGNQMFETSCVSCIARSPATTRLVVGFSSDG
jgi:hypothetical protein